MKMSLKYGCLSLIACVLAQGCATTKPGSNDAIAEYVGQENLDLLFATEYPVASQAEAIAKSSAAYRQGDLDKALFYSVKALKFAPEDVDTLLRIGNLHVLKGNDVIAARAFNLALMHAPDNPDALQGLGLLYFKTGNSEKAKRNLEQAVAGDHSLWQAWNVLGILADDRREHRLAVQYYDKALAVQPEAVIVLVNRGYSKYLAGEYHAAARELYDVASRSNHPTAWLNLGKTYGRLAWYDEAREVFLKVEGEPQSWNRTGEIAMSNGDIDVAYDCFSEAVRESPVYFAEAERNLEKAQQKRSTTAALRR
jgi:tetratricopeptide (TPR) repeat protein